jgi:glycosyltransferase involved in cell wall biosynthesis
MKPNNSNLVTIAIPTFNREKYLRIAMESCLAQKYSALEVLVLDGGSTDNTKSVIQSFSDPRIVYAENKENIGMRRSWNRIISLAKGKYILILGDDDKLHPEYVSETIAVYEEHPDLGFVFTHANKVDINGNYLMRWGYDFTPSGYLFGLDYLFYTIKYGCCLTNSSTMICKKEVYRNVGLYEEEFAKNTFDFNMYIRITARFDVYFLDKVLADYRIHPDQFTEIHWRRKERPTGKIGTYLEILNAIGILLSDRRFTDVQKKELVLKRIPKIDGDLAKLLISVIPEL